MADDSGTPGTARDVVMGGLIGTADEWLRFSAKWDACLHESPSLPFFKMSHAANKSGTFYYFTERQWLEKVPKFVRILNSPEFNFDAIHVTVDVADYLAWIARYEDQLTGNASIFKKPYFYAFQMFIGAAAMAALNRKATEPIELIFDEHKSMGQRARLWFPLLRGMMRPENVRCLSQNLCFETTRSSCRSKRRT